MLWCFVSIGTLSMADDVMILLWNQSGCEVNNVILTRQIEQQTSFNLQVQVGLALFSLYPSASLILACACCKIFLLSPSRSFFLFVSVQIRDQVSLQGAQARIAGSLTICNVPSVWLSPMSQPDYVA